MKAFLKTKANMTLVGFSVLAVFLLLGSRPAWAHTQTFSCPSLPTAEDFFSGEALKSITDTAITPERGGGSGTPENDGDNKYRYAKITAPQLAAGELRIFGAHSNAVLCHRWRGASILPHKLQDTLGTR